MRVERRPEVAEADAAAAGRELEAHIKGSIGVSARVDVVAPDAVERSVGKMRRIIDERPKA